jgi:hypothetical protein
MFPEKSYGYGSHGDALSWHHERDIYIPNILLVEKGIKKLTSTVVEHY